MSSLPVWLHHVSVQFPVVLTFGLAAVGIYGVLRAEISPIPPSIEPILRWGGWFCAAASTVAVVAGLLAAPGTFGGTDTVGLRHHRDMALTTWCVIGLAACAFEHSSRGGHPDWKLVSVGLWCVAAFGALGTAHWGGSELHRDIVPWLEPDEETEQSQPKS